MSVRPNVGPSGDPTFHLARLTNAQAKKLIEYLAAEGYLQQAIEIGKQDMTDRDLSGNCYTLQVQTKKLAMSKDKSKKWQTTTAPPVPPPGEKQEARPTSP